MPYTVKLTQADGRVVAMTGVAAVETDPPLTSTAPPSIKLIKVTDAPYNVSVNGSAQNNGTGLQKAFDDARAQGAQVEIPAGKYQVGQTLRQDGIVVYNNGELVLGASIGYYMVGTGPQLIGGTLSRPDATSRGSQMWEHGVAVFDQSGSFKLVNVTVNRCRAAGFMIWGGTNGQILGCVTQDSMADGFHMAGSSDGPTTNIYLRGNQTIRSGDDMLAFVTYAPEANSPNAARDIECWNHYGSSNTWGRGIASVGARNIKVYNSTFTDVHAFGIYVASESSCGGPSELELYNCKIDRCGTTSSGDDMPDGCCIYGRAGGFDAHLKLHDTVIKSPHRHGVAVYEYGQYAPSNETYADVPGQDVYNAAGGKSAQYAEPARRFPRFEPPTRDGR